MFGLVYTNTKELLKVGKIFECRMPPGAIRIKSNLWMFCTIGVLHSHGRGMLRKTSGAPG